MKFPNGCSGIDMWKYVDTKMALHIKVTFSDSVPGRRRIIIGIGGEFTGIEKILATKIVYTMEEANKFIQEYIND